MPLVLAVIERRFLIRRNCGLIYVALQLALKLGFGVLHQLWIRKKIERGECQCLSRNHHSFLTDPHARTSGSLPRVRRHARDKCRRAQPDCRYNPTDIADIGGRRGGVRIYGTQWQHSLRGRDVTGAARRQAFLQLFGEVLFFGRVFEAANLFQFC